MVETFGPHLTRYPDAPETAFQLNKFCPDELVIENCPMENVVSEVVESCVVSTCGNLGEIAVLAAFVEPELVEASKIDLHPNVKNSVVIII